MKPSKGSIRRNLLWYMTLSSLLPLLAIGFLGYTFSGLLLEKMEQQKLHDLLDASTREISSRMRLYLRPLRFLAELPQDVLAGEDGILSTFQKSFSKYYQNFSTLAVITPEGFPWWISGDRSVFPATGLPIPDSILTAGEGVMLLPTSDADNEKLRLALLVQRTDGSFACGVMSSSYLEYLQDTMRFGEKGKVFFLSDGKPLGIDDSQSPVVREISRLILQDPEKAKTHSLIADLPAPEGMSRLYWRPLYGYGINLPEWTLVAIQPAQELPGDLEQLRWYGLLLLALAAAFTLFLAWRVAQQIAQPIHELTALTQQVAQGNLNVACRPSGWSELNQLGGSFNHMLQRLRKNRDIRTSFKQELRLRNRFEEKLKRARNSAESASQAKSQFLANVSHEIRTPLNAIMGYSEKLLLDYADIPLTHDLKTIHNESRNLLLLINDLLDHAKIEAGKLDLEYVAFDLHRLLADISESFRIQAADKGLSYTLDIRPGTPQYIMHDPLRLRQVLGNLMSNAVKFTSSGGVTLRTETFTSDGRYAQTRFSVIDTGIGIAEEQQKNIFEKFSQADSSYTRQFGGAGLGTAIASQLVTLMGGHMGLSSRLGSGSTFFFDLLLDVNIPEQDIAALTTTHVSQPQMFKGSFHGNVLVAEDYEVNQELIRSQLEFLGMQVSVAGNGRQALEMCRDNAYSLIMMDLQMPEMDGIAASERILKECPLNRNVVILALTANADRGVRHLCRKAGMREVLNKPTRIEELASAISRWLSPDSAPQPTFTPDTSAASATPRTETGNGAPQASSQTLPSPTGQAAATGTTHSEPVSREPVDLQEAGKLFAGNLMVLKMSLEQFSISTANELLPQLHQALTEGDFPTASRRAHKIKGGAASICAREVQRLAGELEQAALDGDPEKCSQLLPQLQEAFRQAQVFLRKQA